MLRIIKRKKTIIRQDIQDFYNKLKEKRRKIFYILLIMSNY